MSKGIAPKLMPEQTYSPTYRFPYTDNPIHHGICTGVGHNTACITMPTCILIQTQFLEKPYLRAMCHKSKLISADVDSISVERQHFRCHEHGGYILVLIIYHKSMVQVYLVASLAVQFTLWFSLLVLQSGAISGTSLCIARVWYTSARTHAKHHAR